MLVTATKSTDFLFTSYVNDFDDNYHKLEGEPSSELEKEARRIRRRYRHQYEFIRAKSIYDEYMGLLIDLHGGKNLFNIKLKGGCIPEFIPHKPRMKNNSLNNFISKKKIILSKVSSESDMEGMMRCFNLNKEVDVRFDNSVDKFAESIIDKGLAVGGPDFSSNKQDPISYLQHYFEEKRAKGKKNTASNRKDPSLTDIINDTVQYDDDDIDDDVVYYRGNFISRDSVEQLSLYEGLNSLGWNSLKIMKSKDTNKKITQILKEKDKRSRKKKKKKKSNDNFMVKIMTDNDYNDYEAFENDMLDFTADNIFK